MFVDLSSGQKVQVSVTFGETNTFLRTTSIRMSFLNQEGKEVDWQAETVVCSPKDQFRKAAGRQIAILRLFKKLNLSKEDRRQIFNKVCPNPVTLPPEDADHLKNDP